MSLRLERAGTSLETFLEDDLSSTYLGIGVQAQVHLARFRSFLQAFYVGQYGYWPPTPAAPGHPAFSKAIYQSMYVEFRMLYEYLVDSNSSDSIQDNRPADGGICVLQNVQTFDRRNRYASLPHPLPLIPEVPREGSRPRTGGMSKLFRSRQKKLDRRVAAMTALLAATNPGDMDVMECPLVREYLRFEKMWTLNESESVTGSDARKVRWILIYAILQTLISVTGAPTPVRDTEGVSYPLCCQIAGTPPWPTGAGTPQRKQRNEVLVAPASVPARVPEIRPDADDLADMPGPLVVNAKPSRFTLAARNVSVGRDGDLQSPIPPKGDPCGFLHHGNHEARSEVGVMTDPSSPASSADGADSGGGWSSSSSEDGMEHESVLGNTSVYSDDEEQRDDRIPGGSVDSPKPGSMGSFRLHSCNPEVEHYIRSFP